MAIHLRMDKKLDENKESKLHLMPCKIHGDEHANVSSYFETYIRSENNKDYEGSFRGYPIQGKKVDVPPGYKGVTFFEHKKPSAESRERNIYSTGTFSKFTYWNYDQIPSENDAIVGALDWIELAEALHSTTQQTSSDNSSSPLV